MKIQNNSPRLGCHLSKQNFINLCKFMEPCGLNAAQIFTKSPLSVSKIITDNDSDIKNYLHQNDIFLVVHGQYIVNGCKPISDNKWGLHSIIDDLVWIDNISHTQSGVVLHLGKNCKKYNLTNSQALSQMLKSIIYILEKISHINSLLLLETSSGQGGEICYDVNEFSQLLQQIPSHLQKNIGVCLDTAHLWASGYDMNNVETINHIFTLFSNKIKLIHLNDSKVHINTRKDRHAPLGQGFIYNNLDTLQLICSKAIFNDIPIILETKGDYVSEISLLRKKFEIFNTISKNSK